MDNLERLKARVPAAENLGARGSANGQRVETGQASERSRPDVDADVGRRQISAVLDSLAAKYVVDGDEIYGIWENGLFYFTFLGKDESEQIYQVSASWERLVPEGDHDRAVQFVNEWNIDQPWPRAQARWDEEDRTVVITCDMIGDFGSSLGEGQLENLISAAISAGLSLFDAAESTFPDAEPILGSPVSSNTHDHQ